jgi:hypothetical protein
MPVSKRRSNKILEPMPFAAKPLRVLSPRKERAARRGSALSRYAARLTPRRMDVNILAERGDKSKQTLK